MAMLRRVAEDVNSASLDGIGDYTGMEAPERGADVGLTFCKNVDGAG